MNILTIDLGKFNSMFCIFDSTSQSAEFLQGHRYDPAAKMHQLAGYLSAASPATHVGAASGSPNPSNYRLDRTVNLIPYRFGPTKPIGRGRDQVLLSIVGPVGHDARCLTQHRPGRRDISRIDPS